MEKSHCRILNILVGMIAVLLIVSCKPQVPDEYIQPDELEDILYDYHLAQAMAYQNTDAESSSFNKYLLYQAVLRKHGVTEAEFDSSMVYYYTHAKKLNEIYSNVESRMEAQAVGLGASAGEMGRYSLLTADGDTANIWRSVSAKVLLPVPLYNKFTFEVEADSTFKRGDSFLFSFMSTFVYQNGTKDAVAYMAVTYDNDSTASYISHISVSGYSQLRIQGNDRNDIKRMEGFICLNKGNDESVTQKIMLIDDMKLIRFHPQTRSDSLKVDSIHSVERIDTAVRQPITVNDTSPVRLMNPMEHSDRVTKRIVR